MAFKVIPGSGTRTTPLSDGERTKRLEKLRVITWSPRTDFTLGWVQTQPDKEIGSMFYQLKFGIMELNALVTIRVVFDDSQSGADMVITNMTTFPVEIRGQGYGSESLRMLLSAMQKKGIKTIRAVQVQKSSEGFWKKNGFTPLNNSTKDFCYQKPGS